MHRSSALAALILTTACWHDVRRERVIERAHLTDTGATVVLADEVHSEKSCIGDKIELGVATVLTFGLAYIINDVIENKLGHKQCPYTDTRWERQKQFDTAFATEPYAPRHVATSRPRACGFDPDDDCTSDDLVASGTVGTSTARGWSRIERGPDNAFHVTVSDRRTAKTVTVDDEPWTKIGLPIALDASGERLVVRGPEPHTCWLVARATTAAIRFDDCDAARWLAPHVAWIGKRLVDIDTGEVYPAERAIWLGKDLGLAEHGTAVDIVRRGPWRVLATVTPIGVIDEPDQIAIIGTDAIVTIRPDGAVAVHSMPIVPGRILDVRGDLALVTFVNEQLTAATIRLSTGELVARTP
jgi:hypothetical protein